MDAVVVGVEVRHFGVLKSVELDRKTIGEGTVAQARAGVAEQRNFIPAYDEGQAIGAFAAELANLELEDGFESARNRLLSVEPRAARLARRGGGEAQTGW